MRANVETVRRMFQRFNGECFGGVLPEIAIVESRAAKALGQFVHPVRYPANKPRGVGECEIRISSRYDMPQNEVEDIVIHEMIHYFIWFKKIVDTSAHGDTFRTIMNTINTRHGRQISVRHRGSDEQYASDNKVRDNIVCVLHLSDGRRVFTVCAKSCIFELYRIFESSSRVRKMEWFWSRDSRLNRFPQVRTPKYFFLPDAELDDYLGKARRCECDGKTIRTVR